MMLASPSEVLLPANTSELTNEPEIGRFLCRTEKLLLRPTLLVLFVDLESMVVERVTKLVNHSHSEISHTLLLIVIKALVKWTPGV